MALPDPHPSVVQGVGSHSFFVEDSTVGASFEEHKFIDASTNLQFTSWGILIDNLGPDEVEISFDGTNLHGAVPNNQRREFRNRREQTVYLRSGGSPTVRVYAW